MKFYNFDKLLEEIGDFERTKNDISASIFVQSVEMNHTHQFHTFQFGNEPIFVFYVPAFWLLLKDLLQHHNAPAHQIYT